MSQTYLDENPPMILDATCSYFRTWPRYATLRMDIRREVKPDIVASATHLPFRDNIFDSIYCDPPHLMRVGLTGLQEMKRKRLLGGWSALTPFERYGFWKTQKEWLGFVRESGPEFARCIKESGSLHYKITDNIEPRNPRLSDLAAMPFSTVRDRVSKSESNLGNGPRVHWLTMRPKPQRTED